VAAQAQAISATLMGMKKLKKVLILFKKSTFQLQAVEHREPRFLKLLEEGNASVARVKSAHEEHYETLKVLEDELKKRNIDSESIARADLSGSVDSYDLVISVGGDGTFLDASHSVHTASLLGVNSSRSSSFGHFCLANIENISETLDKIENGDLQPFPLLRLQLTLNGNILPELILNEVLVCHSNPAGTSRYYLQMGETREEQRSSGIWIGTPAGSTGSLKSAGGVIMPIISQQYQYIVREPWERPNQHFKLRKGVLDRSREIHMVSSMRTGALYVDGSHIDYSFSLGDELIVKPSETDLMAYINPQVNNIFLEG
jgi:NAD+ kinase